MGIFFYIALLCTIPIASLREIPSTAHLKHRLGSTYRHNDVYNPIDSQIHRSKRQVVPEWKNGIAKHQPLVQKDQGREESSMDFDEYGPTFNYGNSNPSKRQTNLMNNNELSIDGIQQNFDYQANYNSYDGLSPAYMSQNYEYQNLGMIDQPPAVSTSDHIAKHQVNPAEDKLAMVKAIVDDEDLALSIEAHYHSDETDITNILEKANIGEEDLALSSEAHYHSDETDLTSILGKSAYLQGGNHEEPSFVVDMVKAIKTDPAESAGSINIGGSDEIAEMQPENVNEEHLSNIGVDTIQSKYANEEHLSKIEDDILKKLSTIVDDIKEPENVNEEELSNMEQHIIQPVDPAEDKLAMVKAIMDDEDLALSIEAHYHSDETDLTNVLEKENIGEEDLALSSEVHYHSDETDLTSILGKSAYLEGGNHEEPSFMVDMMKAIKADPAESAGSIDIGGSDEIADIAVEEGNVGMASEEITEMSAEERITDTSLEDENTDTSDMEGINNMADDEEIADMALEEDDLSEDMVHVNIISSKEIVGENDSLDHYFGSDEGKIMNTEIPEDIFLSNAPTKRRPKIKEDEDNNDIQKSSSSEEQDTKEKDGKTGNKHPNKTKIYNKNHILKKDHNVEHKKNSNNTENINKNKKIKKINEAHIVEDNAKNKTDLKEAKMLNKNKQMKKKYDVDLKKDNVNHVEETHEKKITKKNPNNKDEIHEFTVTKKFNHTGDQMLNIDKTKLENISKKFSQSSLKGNGDIKAIERLIEGSKEISEENSSEEINSSSHKQSSSEEKETHTNNIKKKSRKEDEKSDHVEEKVVESRIKKISKENINSKGSEHHKKQSKDSSEKSTSDSKSKSSHYLKRKGKDTTNKKDGDTKGKSKEGYVKDDLKGGKETKSDTSITIDIHENRTDNSGEDKKVKKDYLQENKSSNKKKLNKVKENNQKELTKNKNKENKKESSKEVKNDKKSSEESSEESDEHLPEGRNFKNEKSSEEGSSEETTTDISEEVKQNSSSEESSENSDEEKENSKSEESSEEGKFLVSNTISRFKQPQSGVNHKFNLLDFQPQHNLVQVIGEPNMPYKEIVSSNVPPNIQVIQKQPGVVTSNLNAVTLPLVQSNMILPSNGIHETAKLQLVQSNMAPPPESRTGPLLNQVLFTGGLIAQNGGSNMLPNQPMLSGLVIHNTGSNVLSNHVQIPNQQERSGTLAFDAMIPIVVSEGNGNAIKPWPIPDMKPVSNVLPNQPMLSGLVMQNAGSNILGNQAEIPKQQGRSGILAIDAMVPVVVSEENRNAVKPISDMKTVSKLDPPLDLGLASSVPIGVTFNIENKQHEEASSYLMEKMLKIDSLDVFIKFGLVIKPVLNYQLFVYSASMVLFLKDWGVAWKDVAEYFPEETSVEPRLTDIQLDTTSNTQTAIHPDIINLQTVIQPDTIITQPEMQPDLINTDTAKQQPDLIINTSMGQPYIGLRLMQPDKADDEPEPAMLPPIFGEHTMQPGRTELEDSTENASPAIKQPYVPGMLLDDEAALQSYADSAENASPAIKQPYVPGMFLDDEAALESYADWQPGDDLSTHDYYYEEEWAL